MRLESLADCHIFISRCTVYTTKCVFQIMAHHAYLCVCMLSASHLTLLMLTLVYVVVQDAVNSGAAITNGAYDGQGVKNVD